MKIDTIRLRLALGFLAIALPIIVSILALIYGYIPGHIIPDSISATYYYDPCITPFMIILGAASIVLICYKGYDKLDDIICTISGLLGLCICLFPCYNGTFINVGTFHISVDISSVIHNITAMIFFALLSFNSFFLFTKGDANPTENKKKRNIIFRVCGIGMVASFLLLIPGHIFNIYGMTWIVETIALAFFGISWLTKADIFPFLFCDSPYKD